MALRIQRQLLGIAWKIRSRSQQQGWGPTVLATTRAVFSTVVRRRQRLIWEVDLRTARKPSPWQLDERLLVIGPDNFDSEMTATLRSFLGGEEAGSDLEGVRRGDHLFVVSNGRECLACSYIFFDTTKETRRQTRIYGEQRGTPIIGLSYTAPFARGRGLYRRVLSEMFRFLEGCGYARAICEVDPRNLPSNRASQAAGMRVCRELSDLEILKRLYIQKVHEHGDIRWRLFWA